LCFLCGFWLALLGAAIWGLGMGVHESIIPAAVATMVPAQRRPSAYGIFTAGYGVAWFIGSVVIGKLYGISVSYLIGFSVATQVIAVPIFLAVRKRMSTLPDGSARRLDGLLQAGITRPHLEIYRLPLIFAPRLMASKSRKTR